MKLYMMIVVYYPSVAICDEPPIKRGNAGYYFEDMANAFAIRKSEEPDLFNYLTNKFNIPDSDKGFIEIDL